MSPTRRTPHRTRREAPDGAGRLVDKRRARDRDRLNNRHGTLRMGSKIVLGVLVLTVTYVSAGQAHQFDQADQQPLTSLGTTGHRPSGADGGTVPAASLPQFSTVVGTPSGPSNSVPSQIGGSGGGSRSSSVSGGSNGIPSTVLAAYQHAANLLSANEPGCQLPVALLAGIGEVESGQARGGRVDASGTMLQPILGPVLDGSNGTAAIHDTDHGVLDGNTVWDRAVGPMQFIPSTWRNWASDGNGDGVADPENIYDAALAAGRYLCARNRDLATQAGIDAAILSYNDSSHYLQLVLAWMNAYSGAVVAVADSTGLVDDPSGAPTGSSPTDPTTGTQAPPASGSGSPPASDEPTAPPVAPPGTTLSGEPPSTTQPTPPADGNPVGTLLCGVQNLLGNGLGGLLGGLLGPPDQSPPPAGDCPQPTTSAGE